MIRAGKNINVSSQTSVVALWVWGSPELGGPMLAKIPLGRFGEPIEIANAILILASSAADLISGDVLMLDGGYTAA